MAEGEVALPLGIVGLAVGEFLNDCESRLVGRERLLALVGGRQHVADPLVTDREVALPGGGAGIAVGKLLADRQPLLIGNERVLALAGRQQHVTEPVEIERKLALPFGIARVAVGECLADRDPLLKRCSCLVALAGGHQRGTDLLVSQREIALPGGIAGVGGEQALQNLARAIGRAERARRVTHVQENIHGRAQRSGLAARKLRRDLPGGGELLLHAARAAENIADACGRCLNLVLEQAGEFEHELVGGPGCGGKRLRRLPGLIVGDLPLQGARALEYFLDAVGRGRDLVLEQARKIDGKRVGAADRCNERLLGAPDLLLAKLLGVLALSLRRLIGKHGLVRDNDADDCNKHCRRSRYPPKKPTTR